MDKFAFSIILLFLASCITTVSQVLLKLSAKSEAKNIIHIFVNHRVIVAYSLFFLVIFISTYAYKTIDYKYGVAMESLSYVLVLLSSRFFLSERLSKHQLIGMVLITSGIICFSI